MTIEISEKAAAALAGKAAEAGKTIEQLVEDLASGGTSVHGGPRTEETRDAAEALLELRSRVKPDPEGLTFHDYIRMGRR